MKILTLLGIFIFSISAHAINGRTTYQAKIVKPDGYPLESANVNFRFTVLDVTGSCVMYVEDYAAVNMTSSGGLISFALGTGTVSFPASSTATTFSTMFDNSVTSFSCQAPGIYNPIPTDNRKIVMQFNDSNGWQTLPAMAVNAVPYAMYAAKSQDSQKLNGKADTAFLQKASDIPTCAAGKMLYFNMASFSCIDVPATGVSINSVSVSGSALSITGTVSDPVITMSAASVSKDGYLTSLDYAEFKAKLAASSTQIINTLGYAPVSGVAVTTQINNSNLSGDVSGTISSNSVVSVGGKTASQISTSVNDTLAATSSNTASTIVKRDSSGNSSFGGVSANVASLNYVDIYKPSTSFNIRLQAPTSLSTNYVLNLPTASGTAGQVLSTDGSGNLSWINAATGSVTSVSATAPLASTGGSNPTISITQATSSTNGYLSSTDWNTFNNKQNATSAAIIATLGYTPANATSATQWTTNGSNIYYNTGNIGVGIINPSAKLELASGTASVAPLKFTSGTLLTSAQSGTMEYDGFNFYLTDSTNTRRTIATGSSAGTIDNANNINSSGNITMTPVGSVIVSSTTASTNSSTGALVVKGGLGVAGNINTAGNLNVSGSSVIDGTLKLSAMTSGSVLFAGANGTVTQDNSSFYWDGANKRLGIGGNAPTQTLSVSGSSYFSGNVGIGTSTPTYLLDILSPSATEGTSLLRARNSAAGHSFEVVTNAVTAYVGAPMIQTSAGDILVNDNLRIFDPSSTQLKGTVAVGQMVLSSLGPNVGEGAQISTQGATAQQGLKLRLGTDSTYQGPLLILNGSGTELARFTTSGNVGIGTTTPEVNWTNQIPGVAGSRFFTLTGGVSDIPAMQVWRDTNSAFGGYFNLLKSRSGGPASNNDEIGYVNYGFLNSANKYKVGGTLLSQIISNTDGSETASLILRTATSGTVSNVMTLVNGNVGIGTTTPSAKLHLADGSTSNAPLKFTSGTLLTSPQSGTMEYDGTNFYLTDSTNIRRAIAANTNPGTYDNVSNINSSGNITMTPTGSVVVSSTTASTNSTTGALVVKGGLGVAGSTNIAQNLNVSGSSVIDGSLKLSSMTSGSVLFAGTDGVVSQDNANFYWDNANKRLGVGTSNPGDTTGMASQAPKFTVSGGYTNLNLLRISGSDTGNTIYSAQSALTLSTGGGTNQHIILNPNGNVGIGTTAPAGKLEVRLNNSLYNQVVNRQSDLSDAVYLTTNSQPHKTGLFLRGSDNIGAGIISAREDNGITWRTYLAFHTNNQTGVNTDAIQEKMRITSDGNVGIGTSSPGSKLEVSLAGAGSPRWNFTSAIDNPRLEAYRSTGVGSDYYGSRWEAGVGAFTFSNAPGTTMGSHVYTERFRIESNGYVGIGTSSPTRVLDVNGGTAQFALRLFGSGPDTAVARFENTSASGGRVYHVGSTDLISGAGNGFSIFDATSATTRLLINPNGNVGIGITNPSAKLHIMNTATPYDFAPVPTNTQQAISYQTSYGDGSAGLLIQKAANTDTTGPVLQFGMQYGGTTGSFIQTNSNIGEVRFSGWSNANSSYLTGANIKAIPMTTWASSTAYADLTFSTNNGSANSSERMRISAAGNVGIGTASPDEKFTVSSGKLAVINSARWDHSVMYHDGAVARYNVGGAENGLAFGVDGGATDYPASSYPEVMRLLPNGNVGIGTTSPVSNLEVSSSGQTYVRISTTASNTAAELAFTNSGAADWVIGADGPNRNAINNGAFHFWKSGYGTAMLLDDNGNVGIGTSSPTATLEVNGTIKGNTPNATSYTETVTSGAIARSTWVSSSISVTAPMAGTYNITAMARMWCIGANDQWWKARIYNQTTSTSYVVALNGTSAASTGLCKADGTIPLNRIVSGVNAGDVLVLQFWINGTDTTTVYYGGDGNGGSSLNIQRVGN